VRNLVVLGKCECMAYGHFKDIVKDRTLRQYHCGHRGQASHCDQMRRIHYPMVPNLTPTSHSEEDRCHEA
jgi:hypothetical protein